jgi:hypothetical protein
MSSDENVCERCQDTGMEYGSANSDGDDFMTSCGCVYGQLIQYAFNNCEHDKINPFVSTKSGSFAYNMKLQ